MRRVNAHRHRDYDTPLSFIFSLSSVMFRAILFMSLLTPIASNAQGGAVQFDTRGLAVIDSPAPGRFVSKSSWFKCRSQYLQSNACRFPAKSRNRSECIFLHKVSEKRTNVFDQLDANGKLSPGTFTDSSLPTFYTSLNVFLVSSQTNLNLTVANSSILTNSQGTVAHVDFTTPQCVPPGAYNVRFSSTS